MSVDSVVRTSLEVGFPGGNLPDSLLRFRGRETRKIPVSEEFPYEDAQFEVVLLDGSIVSRKTVREAHRVLRPDGRLLFIVSERTHKQQGLTLPDVYSIVREGFNIISAERPPWWFFGLCGHTLSIVARKKTWKTYHGFSGRDLKAHGLFTGSH